MIYWEQVNPKLGVSLSNIVNADVWGWAAPEGWDGVGEVYDMTWSEPVAEAGIAQAIRMRTDRNHTYVHSDYLVIYGSESPGLWRYILVGFVGAGQCKGFGEAPPSWWFSDENSLRSLQLRSQAQREMITRYLRHRGTDIPKPAPVPGYCRTCGLPVAKHVDHEPPGVARPGSSNAKDWDMYRKAFVQHYRAALRTLTEDEILKMPLPHKAPHLRILEIELQWRIENPPERKDRMDRLLEGDDLFE